ncbi:MAG TPA: hypothetical protein VN825_00875, partial [Candidatus Acidoferrum sp.]|nr:hypothetical protein [Candidatus Acidoferrum sp.]
MSKPPFNTNRCEDANACSGNTHSQAFATNALQLPASGTVGRLCETPSSAENGFQKWKKNISLPLTYRSV